MEAVYHHHFSLGIFNVFLHKGSISVDCLSGEFNVIQTGGSSRINLGPCLASVTVCDGKANIHIDRAVSEVNVTGGFTETTSGPGYTCLKTQGGVSYVKIPRTNGRLKIHLGKGVTLINCQQMKTYKKENKVVSIGSGHRHEYLAKVQLVSNRCIIDGRMFENGQEVSCLPTSSCLSTSSCLPTYTLKDLPTRGTKPMEDNKNREPKSKVKVNQKQRPKTDMKQKCRDSLQLTRQKNRNQIVEKKRNI